MATTILGSLGVKLIAISDDFNKGLKDAEKKLEGVSAVAKRVGVAAGAGFIAGSAALGKFVMMASDADEVSSQLAATFGDAKPEVESFAKALSSDVGRSRFEIEKLIGTTGAIVKPMLGSADAAAQLSQSAAQLAIDLGSFFNATDVDALNALKSALVGEAEPMKRFGVVMTEANLAAFALSRGITKSVQSMSQAEKTTLRFNFILAQTKDAQGDAVRTSAGFANQLKRAGGSVKELAVSMGRALLPAATSLLGTVNSLLDGFRGLSDGSKSWVAGIAAAGVAVSGIAAALSAVALALPSVIAGFKIMRTAAITALLPLLPPILAIGAGIAGVILIVGALKKAWDANLGGMREKTAEFAEGFKSTITTAIQGVIDFIDNLARTFIELKALFTGGDAVQMLVDFEASRVGAGGGGGMSDFGENIAATIDDVGETVNAGMQDIVDTFGAGVGVFASLLPKAGNEVKALGDSASTAGGKLSDLKPPVGPAGGFTKKNNQRIDEMARSAFSAQTAFEGIVQQANETDLAAVLEDRFAGFADRMGSRAESLFGAASESVSGALKGAFAVIAPAVQQGGERISAVFQGAAQGFQSGGIFGALAGAIAGLLSTTEGFRDLMETLNETLRPAQEQLGRLMAPLGELFANLSSLGQLFMSMTENMSGLGTVMELFGRVMGFLSDGVRFVAEKVAAAFNLFIDGLIKIAKFLTFGKTERKIVKALESAKVEIEDFSPPVEQTKESASGATKALDEMSEKARELNNELVNVPSGFKAAFEKFEAADREALAVDGGGGGNVIQVMVNDFQDFRDRIMRDAMFGNFAFEGSSQASGPFGVPRNGS